MLYIFVLLAHIDAFPEIFAGWLGAPVTLIFKERVDEGPQSLFATTVTFPPEELEAVVIEVVVELPLHPEGNVQVYDVAPATELMEYVFELLAQMDELPLIGGGWDGGVQLWTVMVPFIPEEAWFEQT